MFVRGMLALLCAPRIMARSGLKPAGRAWQNIRVARTTIRPNEIMG